MLTLLGALFVSIMVALTLAWDWDNITQPIAIYRSRPDFLAPILTPLEGLHQPDKMAPGYFFTSPYLNMQPGIYIYDNNAELVYSSFGSYGASPSHAPHVCMYASEPHLCFYQGEQNVGWGHGHGVIMDKHYRLVHSVEPSCTYQASSDMHEFYLIDNGKRALLTQYTRSVYDLCPWGSCDGLGYIQSSGFQEVSVQDGRCLFSWTSLDHISPKDSLVAPSSTETSGSGELPSSPWDYFHINSVDKSEVDGGYLISSRHMCAIYKIDGKNGGIVWQLGGKGNEYTYDNELGDIDFGFQHDARWILDSVEESVLSVFDNGSNGYTETARHSTGKIIHLNHRNKTARLVERPFDPPVVDGHAHLAKSQGNFQLDLSGSNTNFDHGDKQVDQTPGNRILSYGNDPFFSEHAWVPAESGQGHWETVFYGALAWRNMMNYRVLKFEDWVGVPLTKPALWSYSQFGVNDTAENANEMVLYASWNGHTQIHNFVFYGSNDDEARMEPNSDSWHVLVAAWPKTGFETVYRHNTTYRYVYVEAFDLHSASLGQSEVVRTFVPNEMMLRYCDELACAWMDFENENREGMRQEMKGNYDSWQTGKGADDGYLTSYRSVEAASDRLPRLIRYVLGFIIICMILAGLTAMFARKHIATLWIHGKVHQFSGLKTRLWRVVQRSQFEKFDSRMDVRDLDGQSSEPLVMRTIPR